MIAFLKKLSHLARNLGKACYLLLAVWGLYHVGWHLNVIWSKTSVTSVETISVTVMSLHEALVVKPALVALEEALRESSMFHLRRTLSWFFSQEEWVAHIRGVYTLDTHHVDVVITAKPMWGFLNHQRRWYPLTETGELLKTALDPVIVARCPNHVSVHDQEGFLNIPIASLVRTYKTCQDVLRQYQLEISQYFLDRDGAISVYVSDGKRLDWFLGEEEAIFPRLAQLLGVFVKKNLEDVKVIKFISSQKAVVSLAREII